MKLFSGRKTFSKKVLSGSIPDSFAMKKLLGKTIKYISYPKEELKGKVVAISKGGDNSMLVLREEGDRPLSFWLKTQCWEFAPNLNDEEIKTKTWLVFPGQILDEEIKNLEKNRVQKNLESYRKELYRLRSIRIQDSITAEKIEWLKDDISSLESYYRTLN